MAHIRDRWTVKGESGRRVRGDRWGKGRRWQARWQDAAGREHVQAFDTRDAAQAHLDKIAGRGQFAAAPEWTAWVDQWRTEQPHLRESSERAQRLKVGKHIRPAFEGRRLDLIERADVQRVVTGWAESLAPASVESLVNWMGAIFRTAVDDRLIERTPMVRIKTPPVIKSRVLPMTMDQVRIVADALPEWYTEMVWLAVATGMRSGELRGLTWDRVRGNVITVDRQLLRVEHGEPVFGPPKSRSRDIPVPPETIEGIKAHRKQFGDGPGGTVFRSREGLPVTATAADLAWWRMKKADPETFSFLRPRSGWHDLRHVNASALISGGMSPRLVAERLGDDPAEVMRTYAHLWPSDQAAAVQIVAGMVGYRDEPPRSPDGHE